MVAVAIERMGCFHFQLTAKRDNILFPCYISEKLGMIGTDADDMTNLLNWTHEALMNEAAPSKEGKHGLHA